MARLTIAKTISEVSDDDGTDSTFTFHVLLTGQDIVDGATYDYELTTADAALSASDEDESSETSDEESSDAAAERADSSNALLADDSAAAGEVSAEDAAAVAEAAQSSDESSSTAADTTDHGSVSSTGTQKECTWTLYQDGYLYIEPTDGVSGALSASSTSSYSSAFSWYSKRTSITAVELADGVELTGSLNYMFYYCSSLESLDVSGWDVSSVTDMGYMFSNCTSLKSLDASGWDVSSVTAMDRMFSTCTSLGSLDVSGWDVSSVTDMGSLFSTCSSLVSLDLSGWNTSSVWSASSMFNNCTSLTTIYVSNLWSTSKLTNYGYMFNNCSKLVGGNGTTYSSSNNYKTYARIDKSGQEGYLTYKAYSTYNVYFKANVKASQVEGTMDVQRWDTSTTYSMPGCEYTFGEHEFLGWNTKADGSGTAYTAGDSISPTLSGASAGTTVHLYAQWSVGVVYDVNVPSEDVAYAGSMASVELDDYLQESTLTALDDYTVAACSYRVPGYEFAGWNTASDGSGTSYAAGAEINVSDAGADGSVTLYAQWTKLDTSTTVEDGSITLTLYGGEAATFTLPAGTGYVVYEETVAGWQLVASSNTSGEIEANTQSVASFTNTYNPDATQITPVATKTLDGSGAAAGAFSFSLMATGGTDADGTAIAASDVPMPDGANGTSATVANAAGGGIVFGTITYEDVGTYTYEIAELSGTDGTIAYDETVYVATVTVQDDGEGALYASIVYSVKDGDGTALSSISFANTTNPGSLTVKKEVTGAELSTQEFTVRVSFDGGLTTQLVTLDADNEWSYTFDDIAAGTAYEVTETAMPDGYALASIVGSDESDEEQASDKQYASGTVQANDADVVTVTNAYSASGTFVAEASKTLVGRTLVSGEFTFQLLDEDGNVVATASNAADGSITFDAVDVTGAGTHFYTIREVGADADDSDESIVYDESVASVTVTATDNGDGTLSTSVSYAGEDGGADTNTFTNTLKTGSLAIEKTIEGGTSVTAEQSFTFTVSLSDASGTALSGTFATTTSDGDETQDGTLELEDGTGTVSLKDGQTLTIADLPMGASYSIVEASYSGYTTSSSGETGTIEADATVTASFTNAYAASGLWTPQAIKVLTGGLDLSEGQFSFLVLDEDGDVVATGSNAAATVDSDKTATADVSFTDVTYDSVSAIGTHTYTLIEDAGDDVDYTYDDTEVTVTVTVGDNGDGTLATTVSYDGSFDAPTFTNVYNHEVSLPLTGLRGILWALVAAFALVCGSLVVLAGRRRRQRHAPRH